LIFTGSSVAPELLADAPAPMEVVAPDSVPAPMEVVAPDYVPAPMEVVAPQQPSAAQVQQLREQPQQPSAAQGDAIVNPEPPSCFGCQAHARLIRKLKQQLIRSKFRSKQLLQSNRRLHTAVEIRDKHLRAAKVKLADMSFKKGRAQRYCSLHGQC
jgi:hypothetical protein